MLSPDGVPLARQYVCPEEDRPLDDDEIERGYETADGRLVAVSDEELEALAPRRSRDIEVSRFVDRRAIDPAYFERAYFLVPGGEQTKAYRLLAETLESTGRAAIASFVMRGKAYAAAIQSDGGILRLETLRFGDEVRSPDEVGLPEPEENDRKRVRALEQAIDGLAADALDERELADPEPERILALARKKQELGEDVVEAPPDARRGDEAADEEGGEVIDLVALLRQRMRERGGARTAARTSADAAARGDTKRGVKRTPAKRARKRRAR
jgi:DNA end-binding protein Ku